jgi:hypothetical protein
MADIIKFKPSRPTNQFVGSDIRSHFTKQYLVVCPFHLYRVHEDEGGAFTDEQHGWLTSYTNMNSLKNVQDPFRAKYGSFYSGKNSLFYDVSFDILGGGAKSYMPNYSFTKLYGEYDGKITLGLNKRIIQTSSPLYKVGGEQNENFEAADPNGFINPYGFRLEENILYEINKHPSDEDYNGYILSMLLNHFDTRPSPNEMKSMLSPHAYGDAFLGYKEDGTPLKYKYRFNENGLIDAGYYKINPPQNYENAVRLVIGHRIDAQKITSNNTPNPVPVGGARDITDGDKWFNVFGAYWDSAFTLETPISPQAKKPEVDIQELHGVEGGHVVEMTADVDPIYNFLVTKYEKDMYKISQPVSEDGSPQPGLSPTRLPNLYDILNKKDEESDDAEANFLGVDANQWFANYFANFDKLYPDSAEGAQNVDPKFSHVFISNQNKFSADNVNEYKSKFPMYVDINFTSHKTGNIMKYIKGAGLEADLLQKTIMHLFGHHNATKTDDNPTGFGISPGMQDLYLWQPYTVRSGEQYYLNTYVDPPENQAASIPRKIVGNNHKLRQIITPGKDTRWAGYYGAKAIAYSPAEAEDSDILDGETQGSRLAVFDLDNWLHSPVTATTPPAEIVDTNMSLYDDDTNGSPSVGNPLLALFKEAVDKTKMKSKLQEFVLNKTRSHKEVIEGKKAYSEVLLYRVEKKSAAGTTLQNFWLENTPANDVMRYVDTQVKYGQKYEYNIYAYTAVIGTKYRYQFTHDPPSIAPFVEVDESPETGMKWTSEAYAAWYQAFQLWNLGEYRGSPMGWIPEGEVNAGFPFNTYSHQGEDKIFYEGGHTSPATKEVFAFEIAGQTMIPVTVPDYACIYKHIPELEPVLEGYIKQIVQKKLADSMGSFAPDFLKTDFEIDAQIGHYEDMAPQQKTLLGTMNMIMLYNYFPVYNSNTNKAACVKVISEPFIKMVEVPTFKESVAVVDDPPFPPQITILPYQGKNDRILISLDNTVGESEHVPIILDAAGDNPNIFDLIRIKQDKNYKYSDIPSNQTQSSDEYIDPKIRYKTDDYSSAYQIFRMLTPPSDYSDFGVPYKTLDTSISSAFIDGINPNQKYYYMFRSIDKHGHPSNPSPIYEIEMVDDDGAIYLLINIVELADAADTGEFVRKFKRYLKIDPAFLQTLINEDETDFKGLTSAKGIEPVLGVLQDSIYSKTGRSKRFKVRVTSRSTGKKFDLNLEFTHEIPEDVEAPNSPDPIIY